jgi:arginyl-tRNA--protein-N-Asp/Glu arginylyltransferase
MPFEPSHHSHFSPASDELELIGAATTCSYLPDRQSQMVYRLAMSLQTARYEHLLERGWRRFGRTLFRPICAGCRECRSLRIDLSTFKATKSQRRARNRNSNIDLIVQSPTITNEHLELYNAYHLDMHRRRKWPFREITHDQYIESFLEGRFSFSREFQYRLHGKLVALGIVDMTGKVMSSIYFIHDPELRDNALGTMSVLREVEEGQRTGHRWLYMGYYIRDCGSMNYKNRFGPHQLLEEYVGDSETSPWREPTEPTATSPDAG